MEKKNDAKTAAQLLSELQRNPEFMREAQKKEEARTRMEQELGVAQSGLIGDLAAVGVNVGSVWDLVSSLHSYPNAVPVLLSHLETPYPAKIREGIIRALTVPEARGIAAPTLLRAFRRETDESMKWILGNALAVVSDESTLSGLIELAKEPSHGKARQMLLLALRELHTESAKKALHELLQDVQLAVLDAGLPRHEFNRH